MDKKEKQYLCNIMLEIAFIIIWVIKTKIDMFYGIFNGTGIWFAIIWFSFIALIGAGLFSNILKFINHKKENDNGN